MPFPALVEPGPPLSPDQLTRYARHLLLPSIGETGQRRLLAARVAVVGAGGLGSPALLYLAAAGVGAITVVDDDSVDATNLQRQVIHGGPDVGRRKVDSARDAIADVNPHVRVVEHALRLDADTALDVLRGYDVVLDGAAEAYELLPEIQAAGCWVLPHPAMARTGGELKNGTMTLPKLLAEAGVPFALQSGYEAYVPKSRVVLFEAGVRAEVAL